MGHNKKRCLYCKYFYLFFTKRYVGFDLTKHGLCVKKRKIKRTRDKCECYEYMPEEKIKNRWDSVELEDMIAEVDFLKRTIEESCNGKERVEIM